MYKILLIGASGFVGSRLIEALKTEYEISNFDKNTSVFYPEITTIGDIRNYDQLIKVLKGKDIVVLLAAEHKDNVYPTSLYYDVNVNGTKNVLSAMEYCGVNKIIFTSSVAIYGLNKQNPSEENPSDPFNHYGKSKWLAEESLRDWYYQDSSKRTLIIVRPSVIFGERNRGNVYNLLKQIASRNFITIGKGTNLKSMAYVGNVVAFIKFQIENTQSGYHIFNYVDNPDLNMKELVQTVSNYLGRKNPSIHIPYFLGLLGGYFFDILSLITNKQFTISAVRVKKFCATTQFNSQKAHNCGFIAPYNLADGLTKTISYEFSNQKKDSITFETE